MRLFLLKLAYAIEIGAYLAYVGHYHKSRNLKVKLIAMEELRHMIYLKQILLDFNTYPSFCLSLGFFAIGSVIRHLCKITPLRLLNLVAGSLEILNVINYNYLSKLFPGYESTFAEMAAAEKNHEEYFMRSIP